MHFRNMENAKAYAWYSIQDSVYRAIISLFLVAYLRLGIMGLVWGQLTSSLIILIRLSLLFLKKFPLKINRTSLNECLKISLPITPIIFLKVLSSQFDKYMIGLLGTLGGVGLYNVGQKVSYLVFTFMNSLENVFAPQVYKRMFDFGPEGHKSIGIYLTPFYLSTFAALLLTLFAEEIITILAPVSYHGSIDIVIVLSMYYAIGFFGKQPQLTYAKKTHIIPFISLLNVVITISLNIPFILKWGALGAAWATLCASCIIVPIRFFAGQYSYKIDWEYRKVCMILLNLLAASTVMITLRYFSIPYPIKILCKLVIIISYLSLGVKFSIITRQNFLSAKSAIFNR